MLGLCNCIYLLMWFESELRMERDIIELFGLIKRDKRGDFCGGVVKREPGIMHVRVFMVVCAHN